MLNKLEELEEEAAEEEVPIIPWEFESKRMDGLYVNGAIALGTHLKTYAEKACTLAEEMGHHYTSTGNILDQRKVSNRKQERRAHLWAHDRLIGLHGLVDAYLHGCRNPYEIADYLDVTEEFLLESLSAYKARYGFCVREGNYYIYFEPSLSIMQIL